jgi:hypothetical protein
MSIAELSLSTRVALGSLAVIVFALFVTGWFGYWHSLAYPELPSGLTCRGSDALGLDSSGHEVCGQPIGSGR